MFEPVVHIDNLRTRLHATGDRGDPVQGEQEKVKTSHFSNPNFEFGVSTKPATHACPGGLTPPLSWAAHTPDSAMDSSS